MKYTMPVNLTLQEALSLLPHCHSWLSSLKHLHPLADLSGISFFFLQGILSGSWQPHFTIWILKVGKRAGTWTGRFAPTKQRPDPSQHQSLPPSPSSLTLYFSRFIHPFSILYSFSVSLLTLSTNPHFFPILPIPHQVNKSPSQSHSDKLKSQAWPHLSWMNLYLMCWHSPHHQKGFLLRHTLSQLGISASVACLLLLLTALPLWED